MRSAIILLALAVAVQARVCARIGVYGCIDVNTNCVLFKGCIQSLGEEECHTFPESLNDRMTHYMGYETERTQVVFYEHNDCQGARLKSGGWRDVPGDGEFWPAPFAKQASSVKISYYVSPY